MARTAVRCGADSVSLYCLESYDEMPMGEEDRAECQREDIAVHAGFGPVEVSAENGKAVSVTFRKCLRVKDGEGRFAPVYDESVLQMAPCDTVLFCIGQKAEWKELLAGTQAAFNPNGTAKADPVTYQTAEPDIFVGGDVYTGQKFAIDAIAAGKQVKEEGLPNDMVDRIAADPAFGLTREEIVAGLVPENFVGRAPQQVEEFITNVLQPIFDADPEDVEQHASLSV